MDKDFYLNPGLQFEQSIQRNLMTMIPNVNFSTTRLNPLMNWGKLDHNSQFEHTLFSNQMMTSPVSPVSPVSNSTISNNIRTNISLNSSPQKMNLPIMDQFVKENLPRIRNSISLDPNLPLIAADPGFAERAAKFSCFGSQSFNGRTLSNQLGVNSNKTEFPVLKIDRKTSSPALKSDRFEENKNSEQNHMKMSRICSSNANSNEESSVSEQIQSGNLGIKNHKSTNSRKRKVGSNTKKEEVTVEESNSKKSKENVDVVEPPKDYIHVRARRGQATDSHSLAERVRREKISERMKLLQNLVPNCDKVTGKAVMLDEIINYVQSLQRQVEFLSMKLATVNPSLDFDTNNLLSQNVNQSNGNLCQQTSTFYQQNPQVLFNGSTPMNQPIHEIHEPFLQYTGFGQDDLQSIVRMGFGENLDLDTSFFHTTHDQPSNMKIEL